MITRGDAIDDADDAIVMELVSIRADAVASVGINREDSVVDAIVVGVFIDVVFGIRHSGTIA